MREHVVRSGDSPAQIAVLYAGCPKCAADLIRANPHKPTVTMPNGFVTFRSLTSGEKLKLPEKWFDGSLDLRPKAYFAALPYADGVTPSTLGSAAAGILADYATLDAASAKVGALAAMGDQQFNAAVEDAAATIDASVQDVSGAGSPAIYAAPYVQDVRKSTASARSRNNDLTAMIAAGDQNTAFQVQTDILHDFSNALISAQLALQAFYGDGISPAMPSPGTFPANVISTAQAAANAINADSNYCVSVAKTGSSVNSAVHAFKLAWNASQTSKIPINTGNYEEATAEAIAYVIGGAPLPCEEHVPMTTYPTPAPSQVPVLVAAQPKPTLSVAAVAGIGILVAGALGGAVFLATQRHR